MVVGRRYKSWVVGVGVSNISWLLLLVILYLFIFNLHCGTANTNKFSLKNTANSRVSELALYETFFQDL